MITLIDLLSVIDENTNVLLYSSDWSLLDEYDGRESIWKGYNNYNVVTVSISKAGTLDIVIDY